MLLRQVWTLVVLLTVVTGAAPSWARSGGLLTPKPPASPRINGPKVYGVRPNHPFLYRIPCTGIRPVRFSAEGLPDSLRLDPDSGIISGLAPERPGDYAVTLIASNAKGNASLSFKIVVGNQISLTPPMGWNHWYAYYDHITDPQIRQAADDMISSGMADYGYQFVDIDEGWEVKPNSQNPEIGGVARDASQAILPNRRFPDMAALTAYIHAKGLKTGIYSSPGPLACGGFEGSYQHELVDAQRFADWGFDLLKYDWCSYGRVAGGKDLEHLQAPYLKMSAILQGLNRDVVFNLCQYGMGDVWKWGREVGGNSWRTTGDLGMEKGAQLPGFYRIGFANAQHSEYAGPGGWNDPDYLLIGSVGNAFKPDQPPEKTHLTPNEQYSYMSMWSLMAAPLFFSGEMDKLDKFTLNVLCNSEVIGIDQDSLGKQARIVRKTADEFILAKPLDDGSLAVGLFNLTEGRRSISIRWEDVGLKGRQRVRDVWRQRDRGTSIGSYRAKVPSHGVMLVRFSAGNQNPAPPAEQ